MEMSKYSRSLQQPVMSMRRDRQESLSPSRLTEKAAEALEEALCLLRCYILIAKPALPV